MFPALILATRIPRTLPMSRLRGLVPAAAAMALATALGSASAADVFDGADASLSTVTQCGGGNPDGAFFFADIDADGRYETMVLLRVVSGHGGIANVSGADRKVYTFGYARCGTSATDPSNTQPAQISLRFIDTTQPGFAATNPASWQYKTVRSVQIDHSYDGGWMCPRPGASPAYAAVHGYREFNQAGEITATVQRNGYRATHAFDDAAGVKELYLRSDYCENELNNLLLRAAPAPAALPGCFRDDASRALPVQLMASGATPASCLAAAKARGLAYAGVQYGGACFAGNTLGFERRPDAECSMPCTAATGQTCGGSWRNQIQATGVPVPPPPAANAAGCWVDAPQRRLPVALMDAGATRERCVAAASARGLRYAGLQYGGQCFGGNSLAGTQAAAGDCNMPCTADAGQTCGGAWRNTVFDLGPATAAAPAASAYQGCWVDDARRALPVSLMPSGATPASCVAAARRMGFAYAGLQFEGQCWAGDSLGFTRAASAAECNTPCTADPAQNCGGGWRNSIWSTR